MLIDTHCHLDFDSYDADRAEVIARAAEQGVTRIINPSVDAETASAALKLADTYEGIYVALGIHPNSTANYQPADLGFIREQAAHQKVVAVGEIGLDYHWDKSPKETQWRALEDQLNLAAQLELPVIIHNRKASDDVLAILARWVTTLPDSLKDRPGVLHSFSVPMAIAMSTAEKALSLGFYLGFTGPITYKKEDDLRTIAKTVPLHRLLVETDGPFLTPHPYKRKERNEPAYVRQMAACLASLHQCSEDDMGVATTHNAERLFNLPALESVS